MPVAKAIFLEWRLFSFLVCTGGVHFLEMAFVHFVDDRERERGREERLSKSETRLPSAATSSRRHRRCYCSSSSLTSGNLIKFWTFDKELFRRSSSQYAKVTLRYTYSLGNS